MSPKGSGGSDFDRVRPRHPHTRGADVRNDQQADHEGKRALFSDVAQAPTPGSVAITCERCEARSVVSLVRLARLSLPGLHVPTVGGRRVAWRAYVTCPECERRSWVRVSVR